LIHLPQNSHAAAVASRHVFIAASRRRFSLFGRMSAARAAILGETKQHSLKAPVLSSNPFNATAVH
jgi:hypothetical protein